MSAKPYTARNGATPHVERITGSPRYGMIAHGRQSRRAEVRGMAAMTGGQALVRQLVREGIDTIFGLPGIQLDWAFDALHEEREQIRVLHTRHEQATAYMADGYARTTGRIGTSLVVPGPGLLNCM